MKPHEVKRSTNEGLIRAYRKAASEMRRIENKLEDVNLRYDSVAWRRRSVLTDEIVRFLNAVGKPNVAEALKSEHHIRTLSVLGQTREEAKLKLAQAVIKATIQAEQRARKKREEQDFQEYLELTRPHLSPSDERQPTLAEEEAYRLTLKDLTAAEDEGVLITGEPAWFGAFARTYREHLFQIRMAYTKALEILIDDRMYEIAAEYGVRAKTEVVHGGTKSTAVVKRIYHDPDKHVGPGPWSIWCEVMHKANGWLDRYPLYSLTAADRITAPGSELFDVDYSYRNIAGRKLEGVTMNVTPAQALEEVSRTLQHGHSDIRIVVKQVE